MNNSERKKKMCLSCSVIKDVDFKNLDVLITEHGIWIKYNSIWELYEFCEDVLCVNFDERNEMELKPIDEVKSRQEFCLGVCRCMTLLSHEEEEVFIELNGEDEPISKLTDEGVMWITPYKDGWRVSDECAECPYFLEREMLFGKG